MRFQVALDTGPLVALLDASEREHARMSQLVQSLPSPFVTVEPVLTEACFLLRRVAGGPAAVLGLVREGLVRVQSIIDQDAAKVEAMMTKYKNVPMSLADACLVQLIESNIAAKVFTLDNDFKVYRHHGSKRISLIE